MILGKLEVNFNKKKLYSSTLYCTRFTDMNILYRLMLINRKKKNLINTKYIYLYLNIRSNHFEDKNFNAGK